VGLQLTQLRAAEAVTPNQSPTRRSKRSWRPSARSSSFTVLLLAYVLLTVGVIVQPSPVLDLDRAIVDLHLWHNHPQYYTAIHTYVMFGQRGPATLAFLPFFLWAAWRRRSTAPLVVLGTALILLNVSVGVVKYAVGRIGPLGSNDVHLIFAGGNIYPSGHVSNTVVLYGALAWVLPRFRKSLIGLAVFLSVSVGLGTIYLRTHWFSDVVGGWIAGALVLLALPWALPAAQRWTDHVVDTVRARRARRRASAGRHAEPVAVSSSAASGRHAAHGAYRRVPRSASAASPASSVASRRKATSVS
jgi:membrane-associated phospholipid phosphatase